MAAGLSTETTNTYKEDDGSLTLEAFAAPVNFKEADGEWRPIDNELIDAPGSAYAAENAANSFTAKIPADGSSTPVRFVVDDEWVTMRMHGLDAHPQVEGATATFNQVSNADEVSYEVQGSSLKESIVLDAPPANETPLRYTYTLASSVGLTPILTQSGSIEFRRTDGSVSVTIPAGNMSDSAVPTAAYSEAVEFVLRQQGSSWRLDVHPSMDWLRDPARAYPVVIDPSLTNQPVSRDCWIRESQPNSGFCGDNSQNIRVGRLSSTDNHRGLLDFNVAAIPQSATIDSASVKLYQDASKTVGTATADYALFAAGKVFNGSASWNTSGASGSWQGGDPGGSAYGVMTSSGSVNGYKTFGGNMANLIQSWVSNPQSRTGLVVKQHNGPANTVLYFVSSSGPTNQRPAMTVNYTVPNSPPNAAIEPRLLDRNPLSVKVEDIDGDSVRATFEIMDGERVVWSSTSGYVASRQRASVPWPGDGTLTAAKRYSVRVRTYDGTAYSTDATFPLVTDPDKLLLLDAEQLTRAAFSPQKQVWLDGESALPTTGTKMTASLSEQGMDDQAATEMISASGNVVVAELEKVNEYRDIVVAEDLTVDSASVSIDEGPFVRRVSDSVVEADVVVTTEQTNTDVGTGDGHKYVDESGNLTLMEEYQPNSGAWDDGETADTWQSGFTDRYTLRFSVSTLRQVLDKDGALKPAEYRATLASVQLAPEVNSIPVDPDTGEEVGTGELEVEGAQLVQMTERSSAPQALAKPPAGHEASYDRMDAARYARKWTKPENRAKVGAPGYPDVGNNCTNFVSQSLDNAGWLQVENSVFTFDASNWSPNLPGPAGASWTWAGASNFYNYAIKKKSLEHLDYFDQAVPGSTMFYNWIDDNRVLDHAHIVTRRTKKGMPIISQKGAKVESNRHNILWKVWYRKYADPQHEFVETYGLAYYK